MPVNLIVGNLLEHRLYCKAGTQWSQNVRHWTVTALPLGPLSDLELVNAIAGGDLPLYMKDCMSSGARYEGMSIQLISQPPAPKQISTNANGVGNRTGDLLPPAVTGLINFKSDIATRRGRGRMYVPFPCEIDNDANGHPSAQVKSNMQTMADYFANIRDIVVAGDTVATLKPVLVNRVNLATIQIKLGTARGEWASCRRRSFIRHGDVAPI